MSEDTRDAPDQIEGQVGTTIVGGQPRGRRELLNIHVGVEKVLYTAAVDPEFRRALLADRAAAVEAQGFALLDSELAMLRAVPEAQLLASIDGMDLSDDNLQRRTFLRAVAASAATVIVGESVAGCDMADDGSRPDDIGLKPDAGPGKDSIAVDAHDMGSAANGIRPGG